MAGTGRAVVVGGSIGGLLAARALADHFAEVVVLDRDRLPADPDARLGVPQMRHTHGLLSRGREVMEELLPGLTDELLALGASIRDVQEVGAFHVAGVPLARGSSGVLALGVSRPLLEWQVRQRVSSLPGVEIRDQTSVLDYLFSADESRVTGVSMSHMSWPGTCEELAADLVVDVSGRTSRTPEWLERRGYAAPREERVRVDVVYATRTFRRGPDDADGRVAILQPVSPAAPRSGVMLPQEGDRWTVSIAGYHGDRPPTDLAGFVEFARSMPGPLASALEGLTPLDDGATYRFPANIRRRYERLRDFPEGLLVMGDALCAFDPAFGQGMSVAALEALELGTALRHGRANVARRFFPRASHHVDTPWTITVGRDRLLPGATDPVPLPDRVVGRYIDRLLRAAVHDQVLAKAFLEVSQLHAAPPSLMAPRYALRVLAAGLRRRPPAPAPVPTAQVEKAPRAA